MGAENSDRRERIESRCREIAGLLGLEASVSDADIVARDPEIMLAAWCGKPLDRASVLARPGLQDVTAIREGRIHEIPAELILQPGPACLTDGLDFVERVLGD